MPRGVNGGLKPAATKGDFFMSAEIRFKIKGDYSGATQAIESVRQGLNAVGRGADKANEELAGGGEKSTRTWKRVGAELDRAGAAARRAGKAAKQVAPSGDALSRWSKLGNVMSGVGAALNTAAASAQQVAGFIARNVLEPAMRLEKTKVQLAAVAGGGEEGAAAADEVVDRLRGFAGAGGLETEPLLEQVRLATAAGLEYRKAIELVERAWIAAAGREQFASNTVETFVEAMASAGESYAPFVDSLKKTGTDLRPIIAEMTGWDLSTVQEELDKGRVSVDTLLGALRRATDDGTAAAEAFAAMSDTAAAKLQRAKIALEESLLPVAEVLLPKVTRALGDFSEMLDALEVPGAGGAGAAGHEYSMVHGAGGILQGVMAAGKGMWDRLSSGDVQELFNPILSLWRQSQDFKKGLDEYADRVWQQRHGGGAKRRDGAVVRAELAAPGRRENVPVDAEAEPEPDVKGAAAAVTAALTGGVKSAGGVLKEAEEKLKLFREAEKGLDVIAKAMELPEKVLDVPVRKRTGWEQDDKWEVVHSSLSSVGGGGYAARYRPLREVGVQEKQLKVQEDVRGYVRRIAERGESRLAVLG